MLDLLVSRRRRDDSNDRLPVALVVAGPVAIVPAAHHVFVGERAEQPAQPAILIAVRRIDHPLAVAVHILIDVGQRDHALLGDQHPAELCPIPVEELRVPQLQPRLEARLALRVLRLRVPDDFGEADAAEVAPMDEPGHDAEREHALPDPRVAAVGVAADLDRELLRGRALIGGSALELRREERARPRLEHSVDPVVAREAVAEDRARADLTAVVLDEHALDLRGAVPPAVRRDREVVIDDALQVRRDLVHPVSLPAWRGGSTFGGAGGARSVTKRRAPPALAGGTKAVAYAHWPPPSTCAAVAARARRPSRGSAPAPSSGRSAARPWRRDGPATTRR